MKTEADVFPEVTFSPHLGLFLYLKYFGVPYSYPGTV